MSTIDPVNYWNKKLTGYQQESWSTKPNFFAQKASKFFPKKSSILELGCGNGNDSVYFSSLGHNVVATEISQAGLTFAHQNPKSNKVNFMIHNLTDTFLFADSSFDVVFASQSLHFFNSQITHSIFSEIYRVLKKDGVLAILLNNLKDPEIKDYQLIEKDFYQDPNGIAKRYFSLESLKPLVEQYQILLLDDYGTSYKDQAKGITNLIEFIGKKI